MKSDIFEFLKIVILILVYEFLYSLASFSTLEINNVIYIFLFVLNISTVIFFLINLFNYRIKYILLNIIFVFFNFYFYAQFLFYKIFKMPFSFSSISLVNQAYDFKEIVFNTIRQNMHITIIYLVVLAGSLIFLNIFQRKYVRKLKSFFLSFALYFISAILILFTISIHKNETYSAYNLFYNISSSSLTIKKFGLLEETIIDINRQIFGFNGEIIYDDEILQDNQVNEEVEYNIINYDFDELINQETSQDIVNLHEYFKNATATSKNEYTGYYQGKNLIVILAEGFNSIAVDEDLTPTLYKMVNSSFVFNNFYSPLFLSTTGGEFQVTTGLLPTQDILKTWKTTTPNITYSYGNVFNNLGYYVSAYHNWTYTYYNRDKTMTTQGFFNYMACGNGLEELMNCNSWPTSDIDLINVTSDLYMDEEYFMTFYITVSGHAEYNFSGNAMAIKNKSLVENLEYSEQIKAYLACQIELDKALELLLDNLEEKGILEDTVIALVGDHYPYTLSTDVINEISDTQRDELFEVNRSNFILYNVDTPYTQIDKYASNLDVLPTILNLFGIEYDSRMIMGSDIFSNSEGLVIFSDHSWITDKGRYNVNTGEFIAFNNEVDNVDEYVENINNVVSNKFTVSDLLIKTNYYTILSGK